jgi:hypothetical protein
MGQGSQWFLRNHNYRIFDMTSIIWLAIVGRQLWIRCGSDLIVHINWQLFLMKFGLAGKLIQETICVSWIVWPVSKRPLLEFQFSWTWERSVVWWGRLRHMILTHRLVPGLLCRRAIDHKKSNDNGSEWELRHIWWSQQTIESRFGACFCLHCSENTLILPDRAKHLLNGLKKPRIDVNPVLCSDSGHWLLQAAMTQTNSTACLFGKALPWEDVNLINFARGEPPSEKPWTK